MDKNNKDDFSIVEKDIIHFSMICIFAFITFLTLKIFNIISWSWLIVCCPLFILIVLWGTLQIIAIIWGIIEIIFGKK